MAQNSSQDQLLSLVSHELYTPLTAILNAVTLLEDQENIDPEVLAILRRNANRLQNNITQLLQLSRQGLGQPRLRPSEADLELLLRKFLREQESLFKQENVEVIFTAEADLPTVCADGAQLSRVLYGILENAIKFSDRENGKLIVRLDLSLASIDELPENLVREQSRQTTATFLQIRMYAEAASIIALPADLESWFMPFSPAAQADTRLRDGLGISMALAREVLHRHDGYLWAQKSGADFAPHFHLALPILSRVEELEMVIAERLWSGSGRQRVALLLLRPAPGQNWHSREREEFRQKVQSQLFRASDTAFWLSEVEELVVVLEDCDANAAEKIAIRLIQGMQALAQDFVWAAVSAPEQGSSAADLLAVARTRWQVIS